MKLFNHWTWSIGNDIFITKVSSLHVSKLVYFLYRSSGTQAPHEKTSAPWSCMPIDSIISRIWIFLLWPINSSVEPDHLSHIETREDTTNIEIELPAMHTFRVKVISIKLVDIAEFLEEG